MKRAIVLVLLFFSSTKGFSQDTTGAIVILSDKVGPIIDLEERNDYGLFMGVPNFDSAVLLNRPDSSFAFKIVIKDVNDSSRTMRWFPCTRGEIERIRNHIETFTGIQDEISPIPNSIEKKNIGQLLEFSACVPVTEEPAMIFRICYSYNNIGFEPSLIFDTYGAYVLSANIVFSFPFQFKSRQFRPFGTIGYGRFLPINEGMVNLGFGMNCSFFRSWGVRLECIVFTTWEAGYAGPSAGIFYHY
jgi:hypothetical protein